MNEDRAVLDFQDSRIGDGDSEDVGGKVFEGCFAGTDGWGIDVPVDLPDFRGDLIEESGWFHFLAELGFEDLGKGSDGEVEIDPWLPCPGGHGSSCGWSRYRRFRGGVLREASGRRSIRWRDRHSFGRF